MPNLQNKISFDTAGAIANVKALASALEKYNLVAKNTDASNTFKKSTKDIATSSKHMEKVTKKSFSGVSNAAKKAAAETKKASGQMILSWKSVIRIFAIQVIHQALSKITSKLSESAEAAREYVKQLAEIQTIGPQFKNSFAGLDEQVKNFSRLTGFSLDEATSGLYQTLSNQVATVGDEFNFMGSSAKLAVAGVSELDSAVNLLSSAINSYGKSSAESDDIAGKMFKTIELGRFRIEDIANSYGRVLGLAAQIVVELEEVNASMATLTTTGMDHNEALTLNTTIQLKLIKPTKALKEVFDAIGVPTAEAGIAAFGFQGFLQKIAEYGGSSATAMGKLYGRIRAVRGALGLTNIAAERYAENLRQIKEAGKETLEEAKKVIFETNAEQLSREFNRISIAALSVGKTFNSVLLSVFKFSGGAVNAIKAITAAATAAGIGFLYLKVSAAASAAVAISSASATSAALAGVTVATGFATVGYIGLAKAAVASTLAMLLSPIGILIAVAAAAAAVVIVYNHVAKAAEAAAEKIAKINSVEAQKNIDDTILKYRKQADAYKELVGELIRGLSETVKAEKLAAAETRRLKATLFGGIKDNLNSQIGAIESYFNLIESKAKSATAAIIGLNKSMSNVNTSISDFRFERKMKGTDNAVKEVNARLKRSAMLQANARSLMRRGYEDLAKSEQARALSLSKAALSVADATDNTRLQKKVVESVVSAMENENRLLQIKKNKIIAATEASKSEIRDNAESLRGIKEIQKEFIEALEITPDMSPEAIERQKERILKLATDLQSAIGDLKPTKAFDFFDIKTQIDLFGFAKEVSEGAYNEMTKDVLTWKEVTIEAYEAVERRQRKFLPSKDPRVDKLLGPGTSEEQIERGLANIKSMDDGTAAAGNYAIAQKIIGTAIDENAISMAKFKIIADNALPEADILGGFTVEAAMREAAAAETVYNRISDAFERINIALKAGETATKEFATDLNLIRQAAVLFGESKAGEALGAMVENLERATAAAQLLPDLLRTVETASALNEKRLEIIIEPGTTEKILKIDEDLKKLKDKKIKITAEADDSKVKQLAASIAKLRNKTIVITTVNKTVNKTVTAKFGKLLRASGGDVRGSDRIPAMLSRGEFVMNAGATKKMYSQLVSANASYRYLGGPASNNNTYNNTFNVNGAAAPQQTAREIQRLLQRENRIRK